MPYCRDCQKKIGMIDWPNHRFSEHMTEAERELVREELRRTKRKPKPMTDEDWEKLTRGE